MRGEWNSLQVETFDKIIIVWWPNLSSLKDKGITWLLKKISLHFCQSLSEEF